MTLIHLIALSLAAVASGIDLRCHRIPNWLTLGGACAAVAMHGARSGGEGAALAALGWLVGALLLFLPFALGGLGAGDVKLVAALGAWLGPADVLWLALFTGVAGGLLALGFSLARGYLGTAIGNIRLLVAHWRTAGPVPLPAVTLRDGPGPRLAYGVAIFAGTIATVWAR